MPDRTSVPAPVLSTPPLPCSTALIVAVIPVPTLIGVAAVVVVNACPAIVYPSPANAAPLKVTTPLVLSTVTMPPVPWKVATALFVQWPLIAPSACVQLRSAVALQTPAPPSTAPLSWNAVLPPSQSVSVVSPNVLIRFT